MKTLAVLTAYDETSYAAERQLTFAEAKKRYVDGIARKGPLDVEHDPRDWNAETLEEVYDAINYLVFLSIKIRRLQERVNDDPRETV